MTALLLSAVRGTRRKASIALTADLLVTVVLLGKLTKRWLDDTYVKHSYTIILLM